MSRSLILIPDDSAQPILDAINGATKSLRVKNVHFLGPFASEAVIAAQRRGVTVRIMLNPARRDGESENKESHKKLVPVSKSSTAILRMTQNFLRRQLVTVPGAVVPFLYGGKQRQVMIDLSPGLAQSKGLASQDILTAVQQ